MSHVYYSKNWIEKAEQTKGILRNIGTVLGLVILLAVVISSANNMRLMTRARAVGFYQMMEDGIARISASIPAGE